MPLEPVNAPASSRFSEAVPAVNSKEENKVDSRGTRCAIFAFGAASSLAVFLALAPLTQMVPGWESTALAGKGEVNKCATLIPRFLRTFAPLPP